MLADRRGHEDTRSTGIKPHMCDSRRGRVDRGARRRRQVYAGVDVEPRTERIERLQDQGCAAEGEGLDRAGDDRSQWQPLLTRDLGRRERPHQ
jgi:hypothetical protein